MKFWTALARIAIITIFATRSAFAAPAPLPSWNAGVSRDAILNFVRAVTTKGAPTHVPPEDRIAVFDNDGTLWTEQPIPVQAAFALDRVKALAPEHPEWKDKQPFKAALENDRGALEALSEHDIAALIAATHSGMTTDEFAATVKVWLASAKHPRFERRYTECVYKPMLELLALLRANGFTNYVVSGGGVDFMRVFAEQVYGIAPAQVIGSSGKVRFEFDNGRASLQKLPEIGVVDDKEGKPINIHLHIGKSPILAFGNSDGDLQMLQYVAPRPGQGLGLLLHHDDAEREYAYDREVKVGRLDQALNQVAPQGWTLVSMKADWKTVFPKAGDVQGARRGPSNGQRPAEQVR